MFTNYRNLVGGILKAVWRDFSGYFAGRYKEVRDGC